MHAAILLIENSCVVAIFSNALASGLLIYIILLSIKTIFNNNSN